jgi:enterochelin esterase family protein
MKTTCLFLGLMLSSLFSAAPAAIAQTAGATNSPAARPQATRFPRPDVRYPYGPESQRQDGVPRGQIIHFDWTESKVFTGTVRRCAIYVPAQYRPETPAALMVFQDGVRHYLTDEREFRTPIVFDNLIHAKEMPVTIGLFIDPGFKRSEFPPESDTTSRPENRSFEYDTLSTDYASFVIDEMIPHLRNEYKLNITDDPESRAIGGMSSGGICAWTVAWERPDQFGKVVSHVGSFTNIRGGHAYPDMIRAVERKPIRVFLQDGDNDNRNRRPEMNWVIANHNMAAALEERDYDYKYVLGEGGHSGNHGGAIFPDTMRWLWRDDPK